MLLPVRCGEQLIAKPGSKQICSTISPGPLTRKLLILKKKLTLINKTTTFALLFLKGTNTII